MLIGHEGVVRRHVTQLSPLVYSSLDARAWCAAACTSTATPASPLLARYHLYLSISISPPASARYQVRCLHIHSNTLFSGASDCKVKLWDLKTNDCTTLFGHTSFVRTFVALTLA